MIKLFADETDSNNLGTSVLEKEPELKEPPLYQVILLNDDFTPMEFVVYVLQSVFNHNHQKATYNIGTKFLFLERNGRNSTHEAS